MARAGAAAPEARAGDWTNSVTCDGYGTGSQDQASTSAIQQGGGVGIQN